MRGASLSLAVTAAIASVSQASGEPCPPLAVSAATGEAVLCLPTHDTHGNLLGTQRMQDSGEVHDNTLRGCSVAETFPEGIGAVHQFNEDALQGKRSIVVRLCARVGQATAHAECANDFGTSEIARVSYSCDGFGPPNAPVITAPVDAHP